MKRLFILLAATLILMTGLSLIFPNKHIPIATARQNPYVKGYNLLVEKLPVSHEIMLIVFANMDCVEVSSYNEEFIAVPPGLILSELDKKGINISNAVIIIHNHVKGICQFSDIDIRSLNYFRSFGFKGVFLLYCNASKELKVYRGKTLSPEKTY